MKRPRHRLLAWVVRTALLVLPAWATTAGAQAVPAAPSPDGSSAHWQACTALTDDTARLACFDAWSRQQQAAAPAAPASPSLALAPACPATGLTPLSRFWELEAGSDCGTFRLRGYRPLSLSVVTANRVNTQPSSANPANNASTALPYGQTETRIQLSVRTKLAQGLLTDSGSGARDSLWFGYTQQSYWQLFNPGLSRPFRVTDHEPEFVYVFPTDAPLPGGWRLRYSGLGVVHQSNGQSLPLSRSWNRAYLMAGAERGHDWQLQLRLWARVPESAATDDNPGISDTVGRAEVSAWWRPAPEHHLGLTWRHSLSRTARGSLRLEWLRDLGGPAAGPAGSPFGSGLKLHTQLFSGYGDSLLDHNRRRTVLGVGLSLVDF